MTGNNAVDTNLPFSRLLYLHRQAAGMTQDALAGAMQDRGHPWHKSTVSRSEGGQRDPHLSEVTSLADILGVGVEALAGADPRASQRVVRSLQRDNARDLMRQALREFLDASEAVKRHEDQAEALRSELHARAVSLERALSWRQFEPEQEGDERP